MLDNREAACLVEALAASWNRQDAAAFTAMFAQDADFVHIMGGYGSGRIPIEAAHKRLFETIYKNSQVIYHIERVRPLGTDAGVILLLQTLRFQQDDIWHELRARPSMVVRREGGQWRIVLFHNTQVAPSGTPTDPPLAKHPFRS